MLADSKLPHQFWAEALLTYVYLKNRSPTKALDGITPYEAWSGIKPDVSILCIFGCSAYPHVPKIERKKLDIKTRKCVLLGYGTNQKGYRLYDVKRKKIVHSRDVVFDETSLPGIEKETTIKYVELEVSEEPIVESTITNGETEEMTVNDQQIRELLPTSLNVSEAVPRRSTRLKQLPNRFSHSVIVALDDEKDPSTFLKAKSVPNKLKWEEAMKREMESLWSNEVWELVDPPLNQKIVGSKWIFKRKLDADGTVEQYKARLVAQGCTQMYGLDYEETFSPVVRFESVRFLLAIGALHQLQLHQMDVSTAFLHGELTDEVYMRQPEGFIKPGKEYLVCHLKRSIYGLKQSPHCWNHTLDNHLKEMGFKQAPCDPCLYIHSDSEGEIFVVGVYVDDIILGRRSSDKMDATKKELNEKFKMKDLGLLHHFL